MVEFGTDQSLIILIMAIAITALALWRGVWFFFLISCVLWVGLGITEQNEWISTGSFAMALVTIVMFAFNLRR